MLAGGHQRQGKASKKAARKSVSSSNPVTNITATAPQAVRSSTSPVTGSSPKESSATRSRSHSTVPQPELFPGDDRETAVSRRRAPSRASEAPTDGISPDVFEFLEGDPERRSHSRKASDSSSGKTSSAKPKGRPRKASISQLLRTVSGISSTKDHSPSRSSSIGSRDSADYQPPTPPDMPFDGVHWKGSKGVPPRVPMAGAYFTDSESIMNGPASNYMDMSSPEAFYMPKHIPSYPTSPDASRQPSGRMSADAHEIRPNEASRRRSVGSDSNKSSSSPKDEAEPRTCLYRRFEALNHRVIKHLQEELSQLEDDLVTLDDLEEARSGSSGTRSSPRQKLLAAKFQDLLHQDYSVFQHKRAELMEKIVQKTEQYNRSLRSFSKVTKSLPTATEDDVETYITSLQSRSIPLRKRDKRLLKHTDDLFVMTLGLNGSTTNPLYSTIAAIFAAILVPLLAFGAISEFFGRIVVVAFVAGTFAWWASNGPPGNEYLISPQDGWKCALMYFTFMSVAAMFIS